MLEDIPIFRNLQMRLQMTSLNRNRRKKHEKRTGSVGALEVLIFSHFDTAHVSLASKAKIWGYGIPMQILDFL